MAEIDVVLQRQWDMLKTLSRSEHGRTLFELSKQFGVSEKTIKRDVKSIESVFGKLKTRNEAHGRKRYLYDRSPFSFGLALDRNELLAIYIGQNLMTPLQGTFLWEAICSGREKIKQILREDAVDYAERVAPFFYRMDPTERKIDRRRGRIIDEAFKSMEDSRALEIHYRSLRSQRVKIYEIHPYNFVYWRNSVYLVGYCCRDKKIKIWKVDRLSDARSISNKKFKRVEFDVQKYLGNVVEPFVSNTPVVNATVRFTGYAARIVQEENLKAVVSTVKESDDSIITQIQTETGETFTRWILGFGTHAEILDPPDLRERFLDEVRQLEGAYSQAPKAIPDFSKVGEEEEEEKGAKAKKSAKKDKKAEKAEKLAKAKKEAEAKAEEEAKAEKEAKAKKEAKKAAPSKSKKTRPVEEPVEDEYEEYDEYEDYVEGQYDDEYAEDEYAEDEYEEEDGYEEYDDVEDDEYEEEEYEYEDDDDEYAYDDEEEEKLVVKPRAVAKPAAKKAALAPKRQVGRPRKASAKKSVAKPAARKVGRPRKDVAAAKPVAKPAARKVGRPRKDAVGAAAPAKSTKPKAKSNPKARKASVATSTRISASTGKKRKATRAAGKTAKKSSPRRAARPAKRRGYKY